MQILSIQKSASGDERSSRDSNAYIRTEKQRAANKAEWLRRANAAASVGDSVLARNLTHQAEIC